MRTSTLHRASAIVLLYVGIANILVGLQPLEPNPVGLAVGLILTGAAVVEWKALQ